MNSKSFDDFDSFSQTIGPNEPHRKAILNTVARRLDEMTKKHDVICTAATLSPGKALCIAEDVYVDDPKRKTALNGFINAMENALKLMDARAIEPAELNIFCIDREVMQLVPKNDPAKCIGVHIEGNSPCRRKLLTSVERGISEMSARVDIVVFYNSVEKLDTSCLSVSIRVLSPDRNERLGRLFRNLEALSEHGDIEVSCEPDIYIER